MRDSKHEGGKESRRLRLQFVFSPEAYERLERMKVEADATSFAELVRNALRAYEWLKKQEKAGYELALIKDGQQVKSVTLMY